MTVTMGGEKQDDIPFGAAFPVDRGSLATYFFEFASGNRTGKFLAKVV
jgi:hypothetical protein